MKRKEIISRFKVKASFMNFMISESPLLKALKVGTGYASEYKDNHVFLILVGWELHKLGLAFRHINGVLMAMLLIPFAELKKKFLESGEIIVLEVVSNKDINVSKPDDYHVVFKTSPRNENIVETERIGKGFIVVDASKIMKEMFNK